MCECLLLMAHNLLLLVPIYALCLLPAEVVLTPMHVVLLCALFSPRQFSEVDKKNKAIAGLYASLHQEQVRPIKLHPYLAPLPSPSM